MTPKRRKSYRKASDLMNSALHEPGRWWISSVAMKLTFRSCSAKKAFDFRQCRAKNVWAIDASLWMPSAAQYLGRAAFFSLVWRVVSQI
jgi:hypothetical protein